MKKGTLLLFVFLFVTNSCFKKENQQIKGFLHFKLIDPLADLLSIEDGQSLLAEYEMLDDDYKVTEQDKHLWDHLKLLKENDLLNKPYFFIKLNETSSTYLTVYVDDAEYEKIKIYDLSDLQTKKRKIKTTLRGKYLTDRIIICDSIKKVKVVSGNTSWDK